MNKASATLVINVGIPKEVTEEETERNLSIEMVDELNLDSEGNVKNPFTFGDYAYMRVMASDKSVPYVMETNWGILSQVTANATFTANQQITFTKGKAGTLTYPPAPGYPISYEWVGKIPENVSVVFAGQEVKLSKDVIGVLSVGYEALCDIWSLRVRQPYVGVAGIQEGLVYDGLTPHPNTVSLVVASQEFEEPLIASTSVEWAAVDDGSADAEDYACRVVQECSGDPLENAKVYFRGNEYTSGVDGLCDLGKLAPGDYDITVMHDNKTYSYNFTVSEPDSEEE